MKFLKFIFDFISKIFNTFFISKKYKLLLSSNLYILSYRLVRIFIFPLKVYSIKCHSSPGTIETIIFYLDTLKIETEETKIANVGCGLDTITVFKNFSRHIDNYDIINNDEIIYFDLNGELKFNNKSYDIIILSEVIEHVNNPTAVINFLYQSLNKGGRLIITTPNTESLYSRLKFLFRSEFDWFGNLIDYHVHPIFDFYIENLCLNNKLNISFRSYNLKALFNLPNFILKYFSDTKIFVINK